mgnify:CR=1 FL=1
MEGRDLSVLPGSIKWVVDSQVVFMNPETGEVTEDDVEADCTITISNDDFEKILNKEMDSMGAFMSGKMKISGEMTVAMKLSSLFD